MKYTITEQISVEPLNDRLSKCPSEEATHQMEIYKARETSKKICVIKPFNENQFSHSVNSTVHMVPGDVINDVILPAYRDFKKYQR